MKEGNRRNQASANQDANWKELDNWGIVALKKFSFDLDEYAEWLAGADAEYTDWAKDPFTGAALPWTITSLVRMSIETLFETERAKRELQFEPILLVFKNAESKARYDQLAENKALF